MRIKKGDIVEIRAGKNRGKTGKVMRIFPQRSRVTVEGVNVYKKHVRPRREGEKGEIVEVSRPLHISNVQPVCKQCGKGARVGYRGEEGDSSRKKQRVCARCKTPL